jgi:hypothetical protein
MSCEFAFAGHAKHVEEALAPTAAEYVATAQSVHAALPALVLYLPATHKAHAPGSPVLPGGQSNTHAAKAVLAAGDTPPAPHEVQALAPAVAEKVPDTQSVHSALPLLDLDLPATHAVHVPPSAPVYPALQVQAELGLGGFELAEQVTQFVAPTVVEYEFAGHCIQAVLPTMGMYVPTVQLLHEPSPAQTTHGLYCPA